MEVTEVFYGVTHQVELPDGTNMWCKLEMKGSLAEYEDTEQASKNLATRVHNSMSQRVMEAVKHAQSIGE